MKPWALAAGLIVFGCGQLTVRGSFGGGQDEEIVFVQTASLIRHGHLAFGPDEVAEVAAHTGIWEDALVRARDGRYVAVYGPAQALAAAPLYLLGRLAAGGDDRGPGRAVVVRWVGALNPLVSGLTAALLCAWLLALGARPATALAAGLGWGLATCAWPYAKTFLSEPLSALAYLAAAWSAWQAGRKHDAKWSAAAGLALAFAILIRPHNVVLAPILALLAYCPRRRPATNSPSPRAVRGPGGEAPAAVVPSKTAPDPIAGGATNSPSPRAERGPGGEVAAAAAPAETAPDPIIGALPVLAAVVWWLWANTARFGSPLNFGYQASIQTDFALGNLLRGVVGQVLSPGRGLVWYAPPAVLAVFGFGELRRRDGRLAWALAAAVLVQLLFYSLRSTWWGNWCWGPRYLVPVLPLMVVLAALALERRTLRLPAALLAALGVANAWAGLVVYNGLYQDVLFGQPDGLHRLLWTFAEAPWVGHWRYAAPERIDLLLWQAARVDPAFALAALLMRALPLLFGVWLLVRAPRAPQAREAADVS